MVDIADRGLTHPRDITPENQVTRLEPLRTSWANRPTPGRVGRAPGRADGSGAGSEDMVPPGPAPEDVISAGRPAFSRSLYRVSFRV